MKSYFSDALIASRWQEYLDVVLKIPFGGVKHTAAYSWRRLGPPSPSHLTRLPPLSLLLSPLQLRFCLKNIKGSSPTCWPLWSALFFFFPIFVSFCVRACVPAYVKGLHASVSVCVCIYATCMATAFSHRRENRCVLFISADQVSVRAGIHITSREGEGEGRDLFIFFVFFCPGVTGPLQEECLGHMGQRVHRNGPTSPEGKGSAGGL